MIEKIPLNVRAALTPRNAVKFVVGGSVHFVVSTIIYKLVEPEDSADRARTFVGSHVIAGLVTSKTTDLVDEKFDSFVETVREVKQAVKDAQTETNPTP